MNPTIPGLQSSWQPSVYPLPAQAPAAPAALNPADVYSFGNGQYSASTGYKDIQGDGKAGWLHAQAPAMPAAPGYLGPRSAMAYQMAGPRVGFAGQPGAPGGVGGGSAPSGPGTGMVNPFAPGAGGGGLMNGPVTGPTGGGTSSSGQGGILTAPGINSPGGLFGAPTVTSAGNYFGQGSSFPTGGGSPMVGGGLNLQGDADLNSALGITGGNSLSGLSSWLTSPIASGIEQFLGPQQPSFELGGLNIPTLTGAPMPASGGQMWANLSAQGYTSPPEQTSGGWDGQINVGSNLQSLSEGYDPYAYFNSDSGEPQYASPSFSPFMFGSLSLPNASRQIIRS